MNRYKFLLKNTQKSDNFIGLFPWGTIIDPVNTDLKKDQINFFDEGIDFLKKLSSKNIPVVLFINQFKPHPVAMDKLQGFTEAIEKFVREQGVDVMGMYWCPGVDLKDPYVVPNPGMFVRVTENIGVNWKDVPVLSIHDNDLSAANKVKATPIKIGGSHKKYTSFSSLNNWITTQ